MTVASEESAVTIQQVLDIVRLTDKPAKVQIDVLQSDVNFLKVCLVVIAEEANVVRSTVSEQSHAVHAVVDLAAFRLKRVVGQLTEI